MSVRRHGHESERSNVVVTKQEAVPLQPPPPDKTFEPQCRPQQQRLLEEGPLPLHWRGQQGYEEARVGPVFNLRRPSRYPVAILKARNDTDVIRGVQLAAERNLSVAVRSGGHSWTALSQVTSCSLPSLSLADASHSVRDRSLLIDLGAMKELDYDIHTQLVTASPAITGGELNPFLAQWGRFFAGGHCPTVGIGGFLLQGGQGWGARGWGWSCEQIESIDVVLPNGKCVTCSEREHADVFWCARGSGPAFFGVVLRFRLRTRPIPLSMHHTTLIIPAKDNYRATMSWWIKTVRTLDPLVESVFLSFAQGRIFPGGNQNEALDAVMIIRGTTLTDDEAHALSILEPLLSCPTIDNARVKIIGARTSMPEEYAQQLADNPPGRYFVDNAWLHGSDEDVVASLEPAYTRLPSLSSFSLHYSMAPLRQLPDMAFDLQTEHYAASYVINRETDDPRLVETADHACQQWLQDVYGPIDDKRGGSGGTPGQYTGDSDMGNRPARIMSDKNWKRFCEIRDTHDPKHMFCGLLLKAQHAPNRPAWETASCQD